MALLLQASAVRIKDRPDGTVLGAGFLADEGIVVTCAHVVADALGVDVNSPTCPEQPITVDFPLVAPGQWLSGQVVRWVAVQADGGGDIAVLRLDGPAPAGARSVPLVQTGDHWEHPFRTFGYPRKQDDGVPASGKLTSRNAKGWVVMQTTETTGFRVQQGFSGGAVWDGELDGVAGIVVGEETDPEPRVAYMIPSKMLIDAWPPLAEQAIPACPYRGLAAFREQDAPYFFGRQAETQRLIEAVRRKPLVAVIGSSGSGKSSLVYAGLLPHVRKEATWAIATLRPGATPLRSLAAALLPLLEPQLSAIDRLTEIKKFTERLMQGDLHFPEVVAALTQGQPTERLLLVVDQLEEVYTLCQDAEEQHCFLDALLAAVRVASQQRSPNFAMMLTLRADFVAQAITYPPLTSALQESSLFLGPMGRAELQEIITKPAEKQHVHFEDGLTKRLLADVGEAEGNLPLLEFALTSLWSRQQSRVLTHTAYEAIGGVRQALTDHAQAVYDGLTPDEQQAVRRLFVHHLVRLGEGTQDTRRRATRAQVGLATWSLVTYLADARLVVTGSDEVLGEETVEVIHEALIRDWKQLRSWLDEDRELLLWRERLRAAQHQWEQSGGDADALLRGALLVEAQRWLVLRPEALTDEEQGFIQASQEHAEHEKARLEALLEESERRRQEAERQRHISQARWLAALAELLRTQFPSLLELSTLLALEAFQQFPCLETDQALRKNMELLRRPMRSLSLSNAQAASTTVLSPDGRFLAVVYWGNNTVELVEVANGRLHASVSFDFDVSTVSFSPDGRLLALGRRDGTAVLWEVTSGQCRATSRYSDNLAGERVLAGSPSIWEKAFSPDGTLLASVREDFPSQFGTVMLWDIATGQRRAMLPCRAIVYKVVFSPDGRLLAIFCEGSVILWEVATGRHHATLPYTVRSMGVFSSDGRYLAFPSENTVVLWEVATGRHHAVLTQAGVVGTVAFNSDGSLLATASWDGDGVILWDGATGQYHATLHQGSSVNNMAFSPDGRFLAASGHDHTVRLWDLRNCQQIAILPHVGFGRLGIAFTLDSHFLVTSIDGPASEYAWQWEVANPSASTTLYYESTVSELDHSLDLQFLATASRDGDGTLLLWEMATGQCHALGPNAGVVTKIAFSPDGRFLATTDGGIFIMLWEVATAKYHATLLSKEGVTTIAFSPDGSFLAAAGKDSAVELWEVATGQSIITLNCLESLANAVRVTTNLWIQHVTFSPDGSLLAISLMEVAPFGDGFFASVDGGECAVGLWEIPSGQRRTLLPHTRSPYDLAFSPDGLLLATSDSKGNPFDANSEIILWEVATGRRRTTCPLEKNVASAYFFSPDGGLLAILGGFGTVVLMEVPSGHLRTTLFYEGGLHIGAFSPDGSSLAIASVDGPVVLWEVASGQRRAILPHKSQVKKLAFSPDGRFLATCADGTARLWLWRPEDLIAEARSRLNRNLAPEEWQQYLGDEPYRKTVPDLP